MIRRTLTTWTALAVVLLSVPALAAEVGAYVGYDDEFWGASIGQVDNASVPGPPPDFGFFDGSIDMNTVNAWLSGEQDFHGFGLIAPAPSYYGNGALPVVGTDYGWKHMTLTFSDWSTAEIELVEAAFIKRGLPQGTYRDSYYDDMNFHDHESLRVFPVNGAPRPVLYKADLSEHMGKEVVLDAAVSLHAITWSEDNKFFDIYDLPKDYDYTTVTYGSLVFDGDIPPLPPEQFTLEAVKDTLIVDGGSTPWEEDYTDEIGAGLDETFDFFEAMTPSTNESAVGMVDWDFENSDAWGMKAVGDATLTVYFNEATEYPEGSGVTNAVSWYELVGDPDWDETTVTGESFAQDGDVSNALGELCHTMAPEAWGNFVPVEYTIPEATMTKLLNGELAGLAITNAPGDEWSNRLFTKDSHWTLHAEPTLTFYAEPFAELPGDANGDGAVTDADYTIWADNYGATGATFDMGDFNGDGEVTDADYTIWADNYGAGTTGIPEPATLALIAFGGLAVLRRRR